MESFNPKTATEEQCRVLAEYTERLESIALAFCQGRYVYSNDARKAFRKVLSLGSKAKTYNWSPSKKRENKAVGLFGLIKLG